MGRPFMAMKPWNCETNACSWACSLVWGKAGVGLEVWLQRSREYGMCYQMIIMFQCGMWCHIPVQAVRLVQKVAFGRQGVSLEAENLRAPGSGRILSDPKWSKWSRAAHESFVNITGWLLNRIKIEMPLPGTALVSATVALCLPDGYPAVAPEVMIEKCLMRYYSFLFFSMQPGIFELMPDSKMVQILRQRL